MQKSGVVGESLKWDPYGLLMTTGHPLYEEVNRALIGVTTDSAVRDDLASTWLHVPLTEQTGLGLTTFGQWLWIPAAAAAGLMVAALVTVFSVIGKVEKAARNSLTDQARASARKEKMSKGSAAIALQPADQLIHEMAFELHDVTYHMHEILEAVREKGPGAVNA